MSENLIITQKPLAPIEIEMDSNLLTWEDLMTFTDLKSKNDRKEITDSELLLGLSEILSKVVGQDVKKLPAKTVNTLFVEFAKMMSGDTEDIKN